MKERNVLAARVGPDAWGWARRKPRVTSVTRSSIHRPTLVDVSQRPTQDEVVLNQSQELSEHTVSGPIVVNGLTNRVPEEVRKVQVW